MFDRRNFIQTLLVAAAAPVTDASCASAGTSAEFCKLVRDPRQILDLPEGFEYTVAEMGSGTTKATVPGLELDLKDSYGQFHILHMNQDGVIR